MAKLYPYRIGISARIDLMGMEGNPRDFYNMDTALDTFVYVNVNAESLDDAKKRLGKLLTKLLEDSI